MPELAAAGTGLLYRHLLLFAASLAVMVLLALALRRHHVRNWRFRASLQRLAARAAEAAEAAALRGRRRGTVAAAAGKQQQKKKEEEEEEEGGQGAATRTVVPPSTPQITSMMDGTADCVPFSVVENPATGTSAVRRRASTPAIERLRGEAAQDNENQNSGISSSSSSRSGHNVSPLIPSVVDVLKAKGSARERLLHRRQELLKRQKSKSNNNNTAAKNLAKKSAKKSLALGGNRADTLRKMR